MKLHKSRSIKTSDQRQESTIMCVSYIVIKILNKPKVPLSKKRRQLSIIIYIGVGKHNPRLLAIKQGAYYQNALGVTGFFQ
jgi:hypothetical protein